MNIRDWNPADGDACQGDVIFMAIPQGIAISTGDEILPRDGRLIIQEGEVSGHHHAIALRARRFRPQAAIGDPVLQVRDTRLRKAFGGKTLRDGTARLYRDRNAVEALRRAGELTRTDLAIGLLIIEGAPVVVAHEEHDGIRVPPGHYYVGRQIESVGAEERLVED